MIGIEESHCTLHFIILTNPNMKQRGQRIWLRWDCSRYSAFPSLESSSCPVITGTRESPRPTKTPMALKNRSKVGTLRKRINLMAKGGKGDY